MALERQRGITIKSAVMSFSIGDTTVNLIDTPGHPDFIADPHRVLRDIGEKLTPSAIALGGWRVRPGAGGPDRAGLGPDGDQGRRQDPRRGRAFGRQRANRALFRPPTLETAVVPDRRVDRPALHAALTRLAEQDPLINLRQADQEIFISLYGEVQKKVIQATLADDFGIGVTFRETTTICVERPEGAGDAMQRMKADTNPFLVGVGLRIEPASETDRVEFRLGVELGAMPLAFFKTVEESVLQSMGADFRGLTPLVIMEALSRAGTAVFEPLHRFLLDIPAERSVVTLQALPRLDAVPLDAVTRGSSCLIEGEIPAARVRDLERELPSLTGGEGVLETAFERYRRVRGKVPARRHTGPNPLDREDYLLWITRRV